MTRLFAVIVLAGAWTFICPSQADQDSIRYARRIAQQQESVAPEKGFVPDEKTAIAIAKAVLGSIYGTEEISSEEPFRAGAEKGIWTVVGTFHGHSKGGEAIIQIKVSSGEILFVTHTM
ncbi:MAG: NTF2 fold immunity protein [Acidobacteriaceae bacterium]